MPNLDEVSSVSLDMQDALTPLSYVIEKDHVWGAKSKAGKPLSMCVNERAICSLPGVKDCKFYRTVAYVIFKNKPNVAVRYTPTRDGKKIAETNDKYGMKGLLKELVFPVELHLNVPRPARSLKHLRSPAMKKTRKDSAARRKGKPRRGYTSPTDKGFRNGTGVGKAHMWPASSARPR